MRFDSAILSYKVLYICISDFSYQWLAFKHSFFVVKTSVWL